MKVQVEVIETLSRIVEVEVTTEQEAHQLVNEMYQNEEIVLDENDYVDTEIVVLKDYEHI